jgi:hypothetical protein
VRVDDVLVEHRDRFGDDLVTIAYTRQTLAQDVCIESADLNY